MLTNTFGGIVALISKEIKVGPALLAGLHFSGFSLCFMPLSLIKACGGGRGKMKKNIIIISLDG